jgi:tRNA G10  N-methylase Trm11
MSVLTARTGSNAELFPDILSLYVPADSRILDTTYGKGVFWRNVDKWKYYLDFTDLSMGVDARNLYFYQPGEFDAVVFDPPYMHDSKTAGGFESQYRNRACTATAKGGHQAVLDLYLQAGEEAARILRPKGIYIVKTQDEICSGKQQWTHMEIIDGLRERGFTSEDLFVLVQSGRPMTMRWKKQLHARKNHSYFLVFRRAGKI